MNHRDFRITRIGFIIAAAFVVAAGSEAQIKKAMADPWSGSPQKMTIDSAPKLPDVNKIIKRDPFSGAPVDKNAPQKQFENTGQNIQNTLVPNPGQINITPQNGPGAPVFGPNTKPDPTVGTVFSDNGNSQADIFVIATMIGSGKPLALIANGKSTDIVGVGDSLGSKKIRRIVSQGIEFVDGTRLGVEHRTQIQFSLPLGQNQQTVPDPGIPVNQIKPTVNQNKIPYSYGQNNNPTDNRSTDPINQPSTPPNYNFGPLPTPLPGRTPASIPRLFTPPPSTPAH